MAKAKRPRKTAPKLPPGWTHVTDKETNIPPGTKRVRLINPLPDWPEATVGQVYRMPKAEGSGLIARGYAAKVYRREPPVRATAPTATEITQAISPKEPAPPPLEVKVVREDA